MRAPSQHYSRGLLPPPLREGTLPCSPFTPPRMPSHRRLDKGSSSGSVRKGSRGDAPVDVSFTLVGTSVLSSSRLSFFSCSVFVARESFALPLPRPLFCSFLLSFYLVPPAAGSAEGIQSEGKAGREIKT